MKPIKTFLDSSVTPAPTPAPVASVPVYDPLLRPTPPVDPRPALASRQQPAKGVPVVSHPLGVSHPLAGAFEPAVDPLGVLAPPDAPRSASPASPSPAVSSQPAPATPSGESKASRPRLGSPEQLSPSSAQDELSQELSKFFQGSVPAAKSELFNVAKIARTEQSLEILSQNGCWRSVTKLAEILLKMRDFEGLHETLKIQTYLITALLKLKRPDQVQTLFDRIGPLFAKDKLFQEHPRLYPKRKGNMVPFNMHVLLAELPFYQDRSQIKQTMASLLKFQQYIDQQIELMEKKHKDPTDAAAEMLTADPHFDPSVSIDTWRQRSKVIRLKLINYHLSAPVDYSTAIRILTQTIEEYPKDPTLRDYLGRIYLQLGLLSKAEQTFNISAQYTTNQFIIQSNKALLLVARSQFALAYNLLKEILPKATDNDTIVNNFAVCAMYTNQISEAVKALEDLIKKDPYKHLKESVVSNLQSLYNLSSRQPLLKKKLLEGMVLYYGSDDFELDISSSES